MIEPENETNPENEINPVERSETPEPEMLEPLETQPLLEDPEDIELREPEEPFLTDEPAEQVREESKARRFFRKLLRWTAGILIVFGFGFLLAVFTLYQPARDETDRAQREFSQAGLQITDLNSQISDLEGEIAGQANSIGNLRTENEELIAVQDGFNLQIAVLMARLDVANAKLAMLDDDVAQARLILEGTGETLKAIKTLLPVDQRDVISPMEQRLSLVLDETETDPFAAVSDLSVLEAQLLQLESNLFDQP